MTFGLTDALKQLEGSSKNLETLIEEQRYSNALLELILLSLNSNQREEMAAQIKALQEKVRH